MINGKDFIFFWINNKSLVVICVLLFVWWGFLWDKFKFFDKLFKWKFFFVGKKICVNFIVLMVGIVSGGVLYCISLWVKKL